MADIVLVEPDIETAQLLRNYMKPEYTVRHATSSQDAVHLCDASKPDVIVLELALPDQNGVAFLHEIRSHDDWADIPVIVHTHLAGITGVTRELTELGVVANLYKPATSFQKLKLQLNRTVRHATNR